jgi:hypothetical protein
MRVGVVTSRWWNSEVRFGRRDKPIHPQVEKRTSKGPVHDRTDRTEDCAPLQTTIKVGPSVEQ